MGSKVRGKKVVGLLAAAGLVAVLGVPGPALGQTNNNNTNNNTNETNNNNNNENNNANVNTNLNSTEIVNNITNVITNVNENVNVNEVDGPDGHEVIIVEEFIVEEFIIDAPAAAPVRAHVGVGLTG